MRAASLDMTEWQRSSFGASRSTPRESVRYPDTVIPSGRSSRISGKRIPAHAIRGEDETIACMYIESRISRGKVKKVGARAAGLRDIPGVRGECPACIVLCLVCVVNRGDLGTFNCGVSLM